MKLKDRKKIRAWLIKHPGFSFRVPCIYCNSKGHFFGEVCDICRGTGKEHVSRTLYNINKTRLECLLYFAGLLFCAGLVYLILRVGCL